MVAPWHAATPVAEDRGRGRRLDPHIPARYPFLPKSHPATCIFHTPPHTSFSTRPAPDLHKIRRLRRAARESGAGNTHFSIFWGSVERRRRRKSWLTVRGGSGDSSPAPDRRRSGRPCG
jgi:hypothetical protein